MKKNIIGLISVFIIVSLTACGNNLDVSESFTQNMQTGQEAMESNLENEVVEDVSEQQNLTAGETETDLILEKLVGEYEYVSDYGKGYLTIKKEDKGYSIDDYESETSYRFLA